MSLTFLVVDGDPSFRAWCANLLRSLGHDVLEAGTGARATAAIEMCVPDYILIDEKLADVDGALWLERHKALCPGARFVFTSSSWRDAGSTQRLQQLLALGAARIAPGGRGEDEARAGAQRLVTVSYTHLTLPTTESV